MRCTREGLACEKLELRGDGRRKLMTGVVYMNPDGVRVR